MRVRGRRLGAAASVRRAVALAMIALAMSACAAGTRSAPGSSPVVILASEDERAAAARIAGLAQNADVIYLGESHDNPAHHAHQRAVLDALAARGAKPVVAFEMLQADQQASVDAALARPHDVAALDEALRWKARGWPSFAMYAPLFEIAARERWPVVALDLDPATSRRIAREGLAAMGDRAGSLASSLQPDRARDDAIAATIRDGHCGLLPAARIPTMVEAWHARNVAMARGIAAALERARPVVVIVGRGHQDAGGLPAQLAAIRPGTRQLVVAMVEAQPQGASDLASSGDVVWRTPAVDRGDPCEGLRRTPPR